MPKFPDRWFDYSNTGDVIQGTRLITFKVPLKENFFANNKNTRIPENCRFTPRTLLEDMQDRELKLGLVIDLTFTNRYYDPNDFTSNGVQYKKIFVEGHVIPKQEVIETFFEAVDEFLENSEEDSLVGVHCTHGVNRTGYVVCRYMVERLGMNATDALEAYRIARGYPVERVNYINDLRRRAGEHVEEEVEASQSKQGSSSRDHRHTHINHGHKRGNEGNPGHTHQGRGRHYQNQRGNENSSHAGYNHGAQHSGPYSGQFSDQGAYGWSGHQYSEDPSHYRHSQDHGYNSTDWRQQQQQHWVNSDNYYGGHYPGAANGYNEYWGRGTGLGWHNGYNSHIHFDDYSDNSQGSGNRGSYSRQNSSNSRREGRGNRGRARKRQY